LLKRSKYFTDLDCVLGYAVINHDSVVLLEIYIENKNKKKKKKKTINKRTFCTKLCMDKCDRESDTGIMKVNLPEWRLKGHWSQTKVRTC
jgi:hypothetical protein